MDQPVPAPQPLKWTMLENGCRVAINVMAPLGRGGEARVFPAVVYAPDGENLGIYAVRQLLPEPVLSEKDVIAPTENVLVRQMEYMQRIESASIERDMIPRIPRALAIMEVDGLSCMLMDLMPGERLNKLIKTGLTVEAAVNVIIGLLGTLHTLETLPEPVVHRDIKPKNIYYDGSTGITWLHDFTGMREASAAIDRPGFTYGTPIWMAPEQCKGKPYDVRSDIWPLGPLLLEMITRGAYTAARTAESDGSAKWAEDTVTGKYLRQMDDVVANHHEITPELAEIIRKAARYLPQDRYQSAAEMLEALSVAGYRFPDEFVATPLDPSKRIVPAFSARWLIDESWLPQFLKDS